AVYDVDYMDVKILGIPSLGIQTWEIKARDLPAKFTFQYFSFRGGTGSFKLTNTRGTWRTQPVLSTGESVPAGTQGYLQFGDLGIFAGSYDAPSGFFTVTDAPAGAFSQLGYAGYTGGSGGSFPLVGGVKRYGSDVGALSCQQIWYEKAPVK